MSEIVREEDLQVIKVEDYLKDIDYSTDPNYVPSEFALEFVNFIKMVNGERGEEHKTPVVHLKMLDQLVYSKLNICNLCSRGLAKTTLLAEYLFLYFAVYGKLPGFGQIDYALYVSDSIENGVKKMRFRLERRWENSTFLQHYIPKARFTDIRWVFKNKSGKDFIVTGHGAKTGVRGTVELNTRPQFAVLDDLISDEDARSPTVIKSVEATVYKAIDYALHPTRAKVVWSGTPFNARDPLYKAVESGAYATNVFPVCERFPCSKEEFRSAWPDRFTYEYVVKQYNKAMRLGKIDTFNQELMLRIMSEDDRLIKDHEIVWYSIDNVLDNKGIYNFYITTDFAVSDDEANDFSVISVWAYNSNGDWLWVDGICERQLMDKNIDDLFKLVQKYNPQSVGVEISGQQKGFISWIQMEMANRKCYFTLASDKTTNEPGIRPSNRSNKFSRFQVMVPAFKKHKVWFPSELRHEKALIEMQDELSLVAPSGFKSKHDDFADTIGMLGLMTVWKPSEHAPSPDDDKYWEKEKQSRKTKPMDNYIV